MIQFCPPAIFPRASLAKDFPFSLRQYEIFREAATMTGWESFLEKFRKVSGDLQTTSSEKIAKKMDSSIGRDAKKFLLIDFYECSQMPLENFVGN